MREPDFVLEIEIAVPRARLHAFLSDLHNYVPLHPLIESIEEIARLDTLPNARRYRVVDRIPVGPFRLRTVYVAALDPVSEDEVRGYAWQSPGIHLETVYALTDLGESTRLEERVFVSAPPGLRGFVKRQACSAHDSLLHDLAGLLG